MLKLQYSID